MPDIQSGDRVKVKVSIIIVSYNNCELTRQCLKSVYNNSTSAPFEVFVVDNASTDASVEMVTSEFPEVYLIANDKNVGYAAANNLAIKQAKGEYILLLNNDAELTEGSLDKLLAYLDNNNQVGVVGPAVILDNYKPEPFSLSWPSCIKEFFHANPVFKNIIIPFSFLFHKTNKVLEQPLMVDYVTGACFLIKKTVIDEVGFMDENYFIYVEEVDWCYRIYQSGWQVHYLPSVHVFHHFGQSTMQKPGKQTVNWLLAERYKSILLFFKKHYSFASYFLLRFIILEGFLIRFAIYFLRRRKKEATVNSYKLIIRTVLKGTTNRSSG